MNLQDIKRSLPLSILALLLVVGVLYATTTIGTNISTDGTLNVTGLSTLTGGVDSGANITVPATYGLDVAAAGTLNIGATTATTINIGNSTGATAVNLTSGTGAINFTGESVFSNTSNITYTPQAQSVPTNTTFTPTSSYVVLTCGGAGHSVVLTEDNSRAGQMLVMSSASNSSANCSVPQSDGVQEVSGGSVTLGPSDSIVLIYDGSAWVQVASSDN